ncbi:hypothetical protein [Erwinia rhapontici]|uniref:hypothetical protein n=1 Tax=Erwinia rhapontici TaxID=55212 RepID=UPI002169956B|nr:hypothetical protein [Erwinia rhapontici]MCS3607578.1 uncharacterized protein with PQ loop repeat [Erwinia rhapontici]
MKIMISKKKLILMMLTLLFLASYHLSYAFYIYPTFEYAYYGYHPSSIYLLILAYLCSLFPLFFYKMTMTPANYGLALIYTFCFSPSLLTVTFQWNSDGVSLAILLIMFSACMCLLFSSVYLKSIHSSDSRELKSNVARVAINILTLISLVYLIHDNYKHMRFVGFYDVYALRFEARDAGGSVLSGYLGMLLSICFIPYYATIGLLNKKWRYLIFAVACGLLVYASNGSKSTLFMPFVVITMYVLISYRKINFLTSIILLMTSTILILYSIDLPQLRMTKAIFYMRTLATPGWTLVTYYDYFSQYGYTFFSHIGIVNYLTGLYPYGNYSLGQMIGIDYSGSSDANFNANFWASDGFASLGMIGLLPATLFMACIVRIIDRVAMNYDTTFVALWLTGFWMTILNAPITTSLLSGGGIIVLLFLFTKYNIRFRKFSSIKDGKG